MPGSSFPLRALAVATLVVLGSLAWPAAQAAEIERVDVAEAKVQAKARALDADGDGWLSAAETAKGRKSLGMLYDAVARKVDANGDGRVSVDEYVGAQVAALRQADTNADGWISQAEARAKKRKLVAELVGGLF